jgi:hypothetical protein
LGIEVLSRLPKVLSFSPLSPQRGERVRVRGGKEKTFGNKYKSPFAKGGFREI